MLTSVSVPPTILEVRLTPHLHPDAVVVSEEDAVVAASAKICEKKMKSSAGKGWIMKSAEIERMF